VTDKYMYGEWYGEWYGEGGIVSAYTLINMGRIGENPLGADEYRYGYGYGDEYVGMGMGK
jgi:hypothetical protein